MRKDSAILSKTQQLHPSSLSIIHLPSHIYVLSILIVFVLMKFGRLGDARRRGFPSYSVVMSDSAPPPGWPKAVSETSKTPPRPPTPGVEPHSSGSRASTLASRIGSSRAYQTGTKAWAWRRSILFGLGATYAIVR